jgi:hypothetical protein
MAKAAKKATAKKAEERAVETKVIRRRNEKNEVVEIEVPIGAGKMARVRKYVETEDKLLERRKLASDAIERREGGSLQDKKVKEHLGKAIVAIDKRLVDFK